MEDNDKGLHIAWIDSSPEAMRRQEAIRKKERQDKGDEEREQKQIRAQIERAEMEAEAKAREEEDDEARQLKREDGEKITLKFGNKADDTKTSSPPTAPGEDVEGTSTIEQETSKSVSPPTGVPTPPPEKVSLKMGTNNKPKNVFASLSKKNALSRKAPIKEAPKKPMSEAERIMKEEIERKRLREAGGGPTPSNKRPRLA